MATKQSRKQRLLPSGLVGPWLLALIGGGFVASMLALLLVRTIGRVTLDQVYWWGGNLVAWTALMLLLVGTERPRIAWVVVRSTRLVEFASGKAAHGLPKRELFTAAVFFVLLLWRWMASIPDATVIFALPAAGFGVVRVVRRAPFSRWQWIGAGLLIARQIAALKGGDSGWVTASIWFEVILWWLITHRAIKREDDAVAARMALTRASYYIADGQFLLAEEQVRTALPLATTTEIAAAALQVLAASLAGQIRLAEAERALEGSLQLNPGDEETKKRIEEIRRVQLV